MIERYKNKENSKEDIYHSLKKDFINGQITFLEVRDRLLELDQNTLDRENSDKNLDFLNDPEILNLVSQSKENLTGYYRFLSFTEFHVGQRLAMGKIEDASLHFRESLKNARLGESDESWCSYVEGTIIYIEGNQIPEDVIEKVKEEPNKNILVRLNKGLKERGFPDYKLDY